jgi:hypothetical protein
MSMNENLLVLAGSSRDHRHEDVVYELCDLKEAGLFGLLWPLPPEEVLLLAFEFLLPLRTVSS